MWLSKAKFLIEVCFFFRAFVFSGCSFMRLVCFVFLVHVGVLPSFFWQKCQSYISILKWLHKYLLQCICRYLNWIRKIYLLNQVQSNPYFWQRLGLAILYALVNPQRSVAHSAAVIWPRALWVQTQPNSCLPDAAVAVVCFLLKDSQVVDEMKM